MKHGLEPCCVRPLAAANREMFALALVNHCRVCAGWKVLAPWAFPAGPQPSSLESGWEVEGSCILPAWHRELYGTVGTWEIMTKHWLLQGSFRTRGIASWTLAKTWTLLPLQHEVFTAPCNSGLWI